jgi:dUTP pyrophosphatase
MVLIKFIRTSGNEDINIPKYQTSGSAAVDLHAAVKEDIIIKPGERKLILSGICIELPEGFVGEITPRSGLALKQGISIVNSPGIIDSDYRGELGVILINHGSENFIIKRNDRIAQMNIKKFEKAEFIEEKILSNSSRGIGGFGSTGKNN